MPAVVAPAAHHVAGLDRLTAGAEIHDYRRASNPLATGAVPDRLVRSYVQYTDRHLLTCVQKRALEGHRYEAIRYLARYYRWSWLPKRIVAALASLVMTRGTWLAAKYLVQLGRTSTQGSTAQAGQGMSAREHGAPIGTVVPITPRVTWRMRPS